MEIPSTLGLDDLPRIAPFSLAHDEKQAFLLDALNALTARHHTACDPYRRIVDVLFPGAERGASSMESLPYLPVRLFKLHDLVSVPDETIMKTMTSSGTTGQSVSRIHLDAATVRRQSRALASITGSFIGSARLPMLVIDCAQTVAARLRFSARAAGILGFSMFAREVTYALNDDMRLDEARTREFLQRNPQGPFLVFGFTAMVWQHLFLATDSLEPKLDLSRGILVHGGGWKKLEALAVSPEAFRRRAQESVGLERVHDYYGMVEQTGTIFMECEHGRLHASVYSDVLVRDQQDFHILDQGQAGILQLLSCLPLSYPGHSLLTEDRGRIEGEDDCACGRKGKYFSVLGRLKSAEIRGCSDTYAG